MGESHSWKAVVAAACSCLWMPHFRDVAMVAWMKLPRQEILRSPGVLPSSCWLHRLVTQCNARRGQRSLQVAATVAVAAAMTGKCWMPALTIPAQDGAVAVLETGVLAGVAGWHEWCYCCCPVLTCLSNLPSTPVSGRQGGGGRSDANGAAEPQQASLSTLNPRRGEGGYMAGGGALGWSGCYWWLIRWVSPAASITHRVGGGGTGTAEGGGTGRGSLSQQQERSAPYDG
jgi:hypothetical protein